MCHPATKSDLRTVAKPGVIVRKLSTELLTVLVAENRESCFLIRCHIFFDNRAFSGFGCREPRNTISAEKHRLLQSIGFGCVSCFKKRKHETDQGRGHDDFNTRSAEQYIIRQRSECASRTKIGKITRQLAHTLLWQIYNFVKKTCFSGTPKCEIVRARSYNNKGPPVGAYAKT